MASTSPEKKVSKPKTVAKNAPAVEPDLYNESIAQTASASEGELMTNSADKQEVDNDTNESSNLEK